MDFRLSSTLPSESGVYTFLDKKRRILYVGKANNLKKRVASYFRNLNSLGPKTKILVSRIEKIDYTLVESELEALLLEAYLVKTHQPFFNTRAKDDKHPLYIKITLQDEYPKVFMTRKEDELGSVYPKRTSSAYFGPFPSSQTVRRVLRFLRSIFPFDTQKKLTRQACFWSHLGLCNPCPSNIEKLRDKEKKKLRVQYKKNIRHLVNILSRKTDKVKEDLEREMKKLSSQNLFEEAAKIRDQLARLDYVTREYRSFTSFLENPNLVSDIHLNETRALYKLLTSHLPVRQAGFSLPTPIKRIECFDASHTALTNPTVGMVTFINGQPEKNLYRRFRIKQKGGLAPPTGGDDLAFLEEALRRRFAHPEWGLPDLLVIDGGKAQVKRAKDVLRNLKNKIPVVGLVKPFDNLVIPHQDGFQVRRVKDQAALSILQRLRDEAHRFARAYHLKLRAKNLF